MLKEQKQSESIETTVLDKYKISSSAKDLSPDTISLLVTMLDNQNMDIVDLVIGFCAFNFEKAVTYDNAAQDDYASQSEWAYGVPNSFSLKNKGDKHHYQKVILPKLVKEYGISVEDYLSRRGGEYAELIEEYKALLGEQHEVSN